MKSYSLLLVGFLYGCEKPTPPLVEPPEQKIFENLQNCCNGGDCSKDPTWATLYDDIYQLKNIEGKLVATKSPFDTQDIYSISIYSDSIWNIRLDQNRFHDWLSYRGDLLACNLPEPLKKSKRSRKIRFDCKILSPVLREGATVKDVGGYPIDLQRIELLD